MENNNNGRGIFYGVIGVATLVVAIIGATFAYFSASVTRNSITNITATTLKLEIINEKMNFKQDLIPVETDGTTQAGYFARYISLTGADGHADRKALACSDDVGNSICSVYQFTVQNPSPTTAQTVVGSMKVSTNTFKNLYYAVFKGDDLSIPTTAYAKLNDTTGVNTVKGGTAGAGGVTGAAQDQADIGVMVVPKTKLYTATDHATAPEGAGKDGVYNWPTTLETLSNTATPSEDIPNTTTYTVVIWLEETGSDQTGDDAGNTFAAGITFTSNTGAGVTGIISAGN